MGNCAKLRWNRKRLGLTQREFGDLVGLSLMTIHKLETDETAWATIRPETEDKIYAQFESMSSWQPDKKTAEEVIQKNKEDEIVSGTVEGSDEKPVVTEVVISQPIHIDDSLTDKDNETMILMKFAFEGLIESKRHDEFVANLNMIKRIVNRY